MSISRGEVWIVKLDPTQGSEQAGTRPVIVFQDKTLFFGLLLLSFIAFLAIALSLVHIGIR
jgi:mRNA interferase MazF